MATLRELRNQRSLTQAQLAEMVGVSNVTLGKWENGKSTPADETIAHLATIFAVAAKDIDFPRNTDRQNGTSSWYATPETKVAAGTSQVIHLHAGTITVTSTVDFFGLSHQERQLLLTLLDTLDELKMLATTD